MRAPQHVGAAAPGLAAPERLLNDEAPGEQAEGCQISVISINAESLTALAAKITDAVRETKATARATLLHALEAGRLLIDAKAQVPHGEWEAWVTTHCDVAPRTARAFMRLAEKWPTIQNGNGAADLSLREAFKAISTSPTAPPRAPSQHPPSRDRRERAAEALRKAAEVQRALIRHIGQGYIKRAEVERTRTKLQAALAALDELQAADEAMPAVEVAQ